MSLATSLEAFGVGIGLGIAKDSVSLYYFNWNMGFSCNNWRSLFSKNNFKKSGAFASLFGSAVLALIAVKMLSI